MPGSAARSSPRATPEIAAEAGTNATMASSRNVAANSTSVLVQAAPHSKKERLGEIAHQRAFAGDDHRFGRHARIELNAFQLVEPFIDGDACRVIGIAV